MDLLSRAQSQWCRCSASTADILVLYRFKYDLSIPGSLRGRFQGGFRYGNLPCTYSTIKRKCWRGEVVCPPRRPSPM
eukprot:8090692-Pyramimonas_sp.AAC.1